MHTPLHKGSVCQYCDCQAEACLWAANLQDCNCLYNSVCLMQLTRDVMAESSTAAISHVPVACRYGLDYDQQYRSLPFVGVLKPQVYASSE